MMKHSSYEIKSEREKIMIFLGNNINGDTEENRRYFLRQLELLQASCPHCWDTAVDAIQKIGNERWICQICGKRFNI